MNGHLFEVVLSIILHVLPWTKCYRGERGKKKFFHSDMTDPITTDSHISLVSPSHRLSVGNTLTSTCGTYV